ncbi:MAG: lipopolysaccharide biosynthesis protein [Muricauda sp.]|nr:lipopolysaccharide biosynthesis protein [Allomuricauda sp.]MBO6589828.1 lipopolysaccharide biosynthesis protein [Allomuricauda sp.]MBO6619239.1 lipopolysaccharide biosynthesis protein [Allomuricauda sp.]MBO6645150.1 lipopolysaccharide biosynthesis protein [Allomuricauda sp.]MBO6747574.1 lipopolysaccharide biosynthesis protein [Allomuricauda sp.]MBO6844056.1 lipopolysaccharide biosynthesis protein [Allomuricauda sp.]
MSLSNKIKHAGKWQSVSVLSLNVLQIIYFSVMTRLLLKEDYGLMAIINAFIGIGNIFVMGGMGSALIQRKKINNKHINGALQTSVLIGLVLYATLYILAPSIASAYDDLRLDSLIKVSSLNLVLLALGSISTNLLFKNYFFRQVAIVNIVSNIIGYGTGVYLAMNGYGVWSLVIATLVASLVSSLALFYLAPIKISLKFHYKEASELFGFGFGIVLLSFSSFLSRNGLNLIFGKFFAQDILGVYERTSRVKEIPSELLAKIMNQVMFPVMSEIQDENERLIKIYKFGLGFSNSIMIPATVFLVFFSAEIVQILMGPNWPEAVLPLQIMFLILTFSNAGKTTDEVIKAKGLVYKNVTRKYIFTAIILVLSGILGYFYGIIGAAIGIVISHFINYVMMIVLVKNVFKGSIGEYFYRPLAEGLKLGLYLGILIFAYKYVFNLLGKTNVTLFIVFTIGLIVLCVGLVKFKPSVYGQYLESTIKKML